MQDLSLRPSVQQIFEHPSVSGSWPRHLGQLQLTGSPADHSVADRAGVLALSFAQQRLWFITQLDERASRAYHISVALRLRGALDRQALRAALNRIVARHESVRTRFELVNGEAVQRIDGPEVGFALKERAPVAKVLPRCSSGWSRSRGRHLIWREAR